jgi:thiol-disulfide isomerase/thioredoxin
MPALAMRAFHEDTALSLEALRGQVVLLDIWASWCLPCKEEMPLLDELAERLRPQGVTIVAVSVDEDKEAARGFLATRDRWNLTLAHDPEGQVPDRLQPPKMPTSYIIDREGVLREINAGFERADITRIEARLRELAAAKPPQP